MARPRSISLIAAVMALLGPLAAVQAAGADPADTSPTFTGGSFDGRLEAWLSDPFVDRALQSDDFRSLAAALREMPGFAGVYPNVDASYVANWDGPVPPGAPPAVPLLPATPSAPSAR